MTDDQTKSDPGWVPLAEAPFRYRAVRANGVVIDLYPDLTRLDPEKIGAYDVLVDHLQMDLRGEWTVLRSQGGYSFDFLHPTFGIITLSPLDVLPGANVNIPKRLDAAIGGALTRLWDQMTMEFGWAVEAGLCVVRARVGSEIAEPRDLPASAWRHIRIIDWHAGEAETSTGERLFDLQVAMTVGSSQQSDSQDLLQNTAPDSEPARRKNKGGRPTAAHWPTVSAELFRLMDQYGEFSSDDPEWNAQARLEEKLLEFCARKFGKEPGLKTLQGRLPGMLESWRASYPKT